MSWTAATPHAFGQGLDGILMLNLAVPGIFKKAEACTCLSRGTPGARSGRPGMNFCVA